MDQCTGVRPYLQGRSPFHTGCKLREVGLRPSEIIAALIHEEVHGDAGALAVTTITEIADGTRWWAEL